MNSKKELNKKINYLNYLISKNEDTCLSKLIDHKEYFLDVSIEEYKPNSSFSFLECIAKMFTVNIKFNADIIFEIKGLHLRNVTIELEKDQRFAHYRERIMIFDTEDFQNFDKFVLNDELQDIVNNKQEENTRRKM